MTEFLKLLTAENAWDIFRANFTPVVRTETLRVADALDRVLAQDAVAPHDLPTFVRSTVDGYAVAAADTHGASQGMPAYLDVVAESHMGTRTDFTLGPGQAALVHTVSNVATGVHYFCNCCSCCCGILRSVTEFGIQESVAAANYYAVVDEDACTGCGICETRCQMGAITIPDAVSVVDRARCIGCGLCVTGCPEEAILLRLKPESEIVHPPEDFPTWERERLKNRGLA